MIKEQCPLCPKNFAQKGGVMQHIKAFHENIKDMLCQLCSYSAASIVQVQRHILNVHLSCKTLSCDVCDKSFKRQEKLKEHKKVAHQMQIQKDVQCSLCDKSFKLQEYLRVHVKYVHCKKTRSFMQHLWPNFLFQWRGRKAHDPCSQKRKILCMQRMWICICNKSKYAKPQKICPFEDKGLLV